MININMDKAKVIAHQKRRMARSEEFRPYDEIIMKQIPGVDIQATESARQEIREKYAVVQSQIDAATSVDQLKDALGDAVTLPVAK